MLSGVDVWETGEGAGKDPSPVGVNGTAGVLEGVAERGLLRSGPGVGADDGVPPVAPRITRLRFGSSSVKSIGLSSVPSSLSSSLSPGAR